MDVDMYSSPGGLMYYKNMMFFIQSPEKLSFPWWLIQCNCFSFSHQKNFNWYSHYVNIAIWYFHDCCDWLTHSKFRLGFSQIAVIGQFILYLDCYQYFDWPATLLEGIKARKILDHSHFISQLQPTYNYSLQLSTTSISQKFCTRLNQNSTLWT